MRPPLLLLFSFLCCHLTAEMDHGGHAPPMDMPGMPSEPKPDMPGMPDMDMPGMPDMDMPGMDMSTFPKGRYLGFTTFKGSSTKIPTTLDLIIVQEDNEFKKLSGILKFSLGDFTSTEYTTYYYHDLQYSWKNKQFFFDTNNLETTLDNVTIKMGELHGEMTLASDHSTGNMMLMHESKVEDIKALTRSIQSDKIIAPALTGEYFGSCDGKNTLLQVETSKWMPGQDKSKNFLNGYQITGRISKEESDFCAQGEAYCIASVFDDGALNWFSNRLSLTGSPSSMECQLENNALLCDGCRLEQITPAWNKLDIQAGTPPSDEPTEEGEPLSLRPGNEEISGDFYGYLMNETLNRKKAFRVRINAFGYNDRPNRPEISQVAVNAWLHLGESFDKESIAIDFEKRPFLHTMPHFTLRSEDGLFIIVEKWTKSTLSGSLYSTSFGHVGQFKVARKHPDEQMTHSTPPAFESLSGNFYSEQWIKSGLKTAKHSANAVKRSDWHLSMQYLGDIGESDDNALFKPSVAGFLQMEGLTSKIFIKSFSYDIFTDALSFKLSDDRYVSGLRAHHNLRLYIPSLEQWGTVTKRHGQTNSFERSQS